LLTNFGVKARFTKRHYHTEIKIGFANP